MKKSLALLLSLCMIFALCSCGLTAPEAKDPVADFPAKPLTVIVPYSAGGSCDIATRRLAALMEKELGRSITVINQGGSSGAIGIQSCLDAEPDGYTMVMTADSLGTLRVMGLSETVSYEEFTPIAAVTSDPKLIVVSKDSPYNSLEDLLKDMKANPGKIKLSYTGPGGSGHVQALILNALGYDMALTAYAGGSDCLLAVLSRQVDFTNANYSTLVPFLESGDLKCLAAASRERLAALPDVPTMGEIIPGADQYLRFPFTPFILQVSRDVDPRIVEILREAALNAMATEDWSSFVEGSCQEKLYEQYPTQEDVIGFIRGFESMVSWMLYEAGAAQFSPEDFGIPRP